jgi:hypothetical protein
VSVPGLLSSSGSSQQLSSARSTVKQGILLVVMVSLSSLPNFSSFSHKEHSLILFLLVQPPADDDDLDEEEEDEEDDDIPVPSVVKSVAKLETSAQVEYARMPTKVQAMIDTAVSHDPQEILHHWSPKKIVSSYTDPQGVRHLTVLFALTGGVLAEDNSGVEIKVTKGGFELTLTEKFPDLQLDMESYFHHFDKDPRETAEEFNRRRSAMMETIRMMKAYSLDGLLASTYRYMLPFRVEPSEMRITYTGTLDGCRLAQIDMAERQQAQKQLVNIVRKVRPQGGATFDCQYMKITD